MITCKIHAPSPRILFWKKWKDGFSLHAGGGENTVGLCLKNLSSPMRNQGDHTVGAPSQSLEKRASMQGSCILSL